VMTLGVLEEALASFGGCALIVSHDRWFLDKVATAILAFEGNGRVQLYEGSCSDYLARPRAVGPAAPSARARPTREATAAAATAAGAGPEKARPRKRTFKEKQELEVIEPAILAAEREATALEETLQSSAFYATRAAEAPELIARLEATRRRIEALYARWQELEVVPE